MWAMKVIAKKITDEAKWEEAYKQWQVRRRIDTLEDFERRKTYNDMLEKLAGQPPRQNSVAGERKGAQMYNVATAKGNASSKFVRTDGLALPKKKYVPTDITHHADFNELVHIDHKSAVEMMLETHPVTNIKSYHKPDGVKSHFHSTAESHYPETGQVHARAAPPPPDDYDLNSFPQRRVAKDVTLNNKYSMHDSQQVPQRPTTYRSTCDSWRQSRAKSRELNENFIEDLPDISPRSRKAQKEGVPMCVKLWTNPLPGNNQTMTDLPEMGLKKSASVPSGACISKGYNDAPQSTQALCSEIDKFENKLYSVSDPRFGNDFLSMPTANRKLSNAKLMATQERVVQAEKTLEDDVKKAKFPDRAPYNDWTFTSSD